MTLVDSGEPWLGKVPSDWEKTRIRNVATLSPGYSATSPASLESCVFVPMESLSEDGNIDTSSQMPFENIQSGLTTFELGDVLFAKITPCMENGKGAFVAVLPTRYGFGSTEFHVLRPNHGIDGRFLYYYTFNPLFRAYAAENMTGAAGQKRVSSRFLKDTRIFLPSLHEQRAIADFLDASCRLVDSVASIGEKERNGANSVGILNRQMIALRAYRGMLIHECVTGQRRITEADVLRLKDNINIDVV